MNNSGYITFRCIYFFKFELLILYIVQCPNMQAINRMTTYPIVNKEAWEYYEKARGSFWTANEITLSADKIHFKTKLVDSERHFVINIAALFSSFDGLVNVNIVGRLREEFADLEIKYFYDFQVMIENIHAEMYSRILWELVESADERARLLAALDTIPIIGKMGQFMTKTAVSDESLPVRLLRQACVEGGFFTGCFCVIYWLQSRGLMPGLGQSNEFIARDEGLHTKFAIYLYHLCSPVPDAEIYAIVDEAVVLACEFMQESMLMDMQEMNYKKITDYVKHIADN